MRLFGREHIRRIKNCESAQLDAAELRSVCEMAELHRQHVRHLESRGRQVERTAHSKNQYMSIEEAQKVWHILPYHPFAKHRIPPTQHIAPSHHVLWTR